MVCFIPHFWFGINLLLWYSGGKHWGEFVGFPKGYADAELAVSVARFWSPAFIWFYIWFYRNRAFCWVLENAVRQPLATLVDMGKCIYFI